jgi:hypothetical protein
MWLIAEYRPTSLFSLKPAWATSSGGKSLLLPTPYAVKMAILDVACRSEGVARARDAWPTIASLQIALRGPERVVVSNTFTKILKPRRGSPAPGSADAGPLQKSIGFREYVYHDGTVAIGLAVTNSDDIDRIVDWLLQVNYLGRRGGLVQLLAAPVVMDDLPAGFVVINQDHTTGIPIEGIVQPMDDTSPKVSFAKVDIYSGENITSGKERILHHVVLPYRLVSSSRGYTLYERFDP